jgi:hypothetical protein
MSRILSAVCVLAVALLMFAPPASARLTGALWTTTAQGEKVNGNLYDLKCPLPPPADPCASPPLVPFLNGGPNFAHPGSWVPDGQYYFQVTDPAGKVLLSTDNIECRRFNVWTDGSGGKHILYPLPGNLCAHQVCTDIHTGITTIALCPFLDTPNNGGVYKLWITRVSDYAPGQGRFGFIPRNTKTDNFKVKKLASIWGDKVDENGDPVPSLCVCLYSVQKVRGQDTLVKIACTVTNADGQFSFSNLPTGRYCVDESLSGSACDPELEAIDYSGILERVSPSGPICFNITRGQARSGTPIYIGRFVNGEVPRVAAIAGRKFLDVNGNGVWDPATEPPLACWVITLEEKTGPSTWQQAHDLSGNLVPPRITGPDGTYNFGNLPVNMTYRICEVLKAGWKQTAPNTGPDELIIEPGGGPCGLAVAPVGADVTVVAKNGCYIVNFAPTAVAETIVSGLCFGNKLAKLCVEKKQDGTNAPLAGWEFRLYEADGVTPAQMPDPSPPNPGGCLQCVCPLDPNPNNCGYCPYSVLKPVPPIITGADGKACWDGLLGGNYVVKETVKNGWQPVPPGSNVQPVTLPAGETVTVTFVNHSICMGLTPGYWKNWRNHYTSAQFCALLQGTIADVGDCTADIAEADAIFEHWDASPGDELTILQAFLLADQLTLNLTQNPGLPNPSGGSLVPECVCGTGLCACGSVSVGDAIASALEILADPGSYSRDYMLTIKNQLAAFAEANCP